MLFANQGDSDLCKEEKTTNDFQGWWESSYQFSMMSSLHYTSARTHVNLMKFIFPRIFKWLLSRWTQKLCSEMIMMMSAVWLSPVHLKKTRVSITLSASLFSPVRRRGRLLIKLFHFSTFSTVLIRPVECAFEIHRWYWWVQEQCR